MPQLRLTDQTIRSLKSETRREIWDSKVPAFGVRVGPRSKTFIAKVRNRRISLGTYPATTLQEARRKALTLKGSPPTQATSITLGEAIDLFLSTHCRNLRPASLKQAKHLLGKLAALRTKKLSAITTHDLNAILDRQKPQSANHTFAQARTFFRFCVRRKLIPQSPLQDQLKPHKSGSRSRVLTDDELKSIWRACDQAGEAPGHHERACDPGERNAFGSPRLPAHFATIVKLLICLGARRGEVAALRRSWISENRITWPPEVMKNARGHWLPLLPFTKSIIDAIPDTGDLLFPGRFVGEIYKNWCRTSIALKELSGVENFVLHDIRRSWASHNAAWAPPHIIERALGHAGGQISGIAAVYNRYQYEKELIACYQQWEAHLTALFAAPQQAKAA